MKKNILNAIEFAHLAHDGQYRKGTQIPYASHVIAVGFILLHYGYDENTVIAGMLHDTLEDTAVTIDEIRALFGDDVARIVLECSEDKKDDWETRKKKTLRTLTTMPLDSLRVLLADKTHNLISILQEKREIGDSVFDRFNRGKEAQEWYYGSIVSTLKNDHRMANEELFVSYSSICAELFEEH